MNSKKGQSALEYLMTYGYALVVVVVLIAGLILIAAPPSTKVSFQSSDSKIIVSNSVVSLSGSTPLYQVKLINASGRNLTINAITPSNLTLDPPFDSCNPGPCSIPVTTGQTMLLTGELQPIYTNTGSLRISYNDGSFPKEATLTASGQNPAASLIVPLSSCGTPASGWESGKTYYLTGPVQASPSQYCFILTTPNTTLDCVDYARIIQNNGSPTVQINTASTTPTTIKNCKLSMTGAYIGISITNSNVKIIHNQIENSQNGITLSGANSSDSEINRNQIINATSSGIWMLSGTIHRLIITNNSISTGTPGTGFNIRGNNHTITNNAITVGLGGTGYTMTSGGSTGVLLANNSFCGVNLASLPATGILIQSNDPQAVGSINNTCSGSTAACQHIGTGGSNVCLSGNLCQNPCP